MASIYSHWLCRSALVGALLLSSGCATVQQWQQRPGWQKAQATATQGLNEVRDAFGRLINPADPMTAADYAAACVERSRLARPAVSGQVIDSPRYALVTLQQLGQTAPMSSGELCIVNKVTQIIDVTAVDNLRFLPQPVGSIPARR